MRDCATVLGLIACLTTLTTAASGAPPASASPAKEQVLLRGPLHEAFAAPLAGADQPAAIVADRPGPTLDELPTAVKPAASNAVWIPGYWGWEPAAEEFVWVPGIWRVPPPGMRWVPGYWSTVEGGFRWVRGFWYPVMEPRAALSSPAAQKPSRTTRFARHSRAIHRARALGVRARPISMDAWLYGPP